MEKSAKRYYAILDHNIVSSCNKLVHKTINTKTTTTIKTIKHIFGPRIYTGNKEICPGK